jgi:hypothetical protein
VGKKKQILQAAGQGLHFSQELFFPFFFGGQKRNKKAHKRRELQDRRLIGLD